MVTWQSVVEGGSRVHALAVDLKLSGEQHQNAHESYMSFHKIFCLYSS